MDEEDDIGDIDLGFGAPRLRATAPLMKCTSPATEAHDCHSRPRFWRVSTCQVPDTLKCVLRLCSVAARGRHEAHRLMCSNRNTDDALRSTHSRAPAGSDPDEDVGGGVLPAASAMEAEGVKEEAAPADTPADAQTPDTAADVKPGADKADAKALVVHGAHAAPQKREGYGNVVSISDLTWYTTDIEVEAACTQFGAVKTIKFFEDRSNGRSAGSCIVEFESHEQARACIEGLHKKKVGESDATVSWPNRQKPGIAKHRRASPWQSCSAGYCTFGPD